MTTPSAQEQGFEDLANIKQQPHNSNSNTASINGATPSMPRAENEFVHHSQPAQVGAPAHYVGQGYTFVPNMHVTPNGIYPVAFHAGDVYDPLKSMAGQPRFMDNSQTAQQPQLSMAHMVAPNGHAKPGEPLKLMATSPPPAGAGAFAYDERFHVMYEREIRWTEVRKYSEFIRRFAAEASHMEITKENYYDLYNMALCLLKSVDGLDPDKLGRKQSEFSFNATGMGSTQPTVSPMAAMAVPSAAPLDADMHRRNLEALSRPATSAFDQAPTFLGLPKYATMVTPTDPPGVFTYGTTTPDGTVQPGLMTPYGYSVNQFGQQAPPVSAKGKNFAGEVFFEENNVPGDRAKRRRRRTAYSSKRNLHCHMCGVTETPEWRRGPAGDHTLCNACGLHYAKSLKKQRKERDARKHSIDLLLNENQAAISVDGENNPTPLLDAPPPTSPLPMALMGPSSDA